jgi:Secretion system C-terminal sorting domain
MTGRSVKQVDLRGNFSTSLDVSSLNRGIYLLQVKTVEGETVSSKFIKE